MITFFNNKNLDLRISFNSIWQGLGVVLSICQKEVLQYLSTVSLDYTIMLK